MDSNNINEVKEFFSLQDVASYLKISDSTVYRYINRYKKPLPAMKISRKKIVIKKVDLDKWLEEQKNG
jgi:excisionase family DNA binding protein